MLGGSGDSELVEGAALDLSSTRTHPVNALNNLRNEWKSEAYTLQLLAQEYFVTNCSSLGVDDDLDEAPDVNLAFLEATLRYADFFFGKYEMPADVLQEDTDTHFDSSEVNDVIKALVALRQAKPEERTSAAEEVKSAFNDAWYTPPEEVEYRFQFGRLGLWHNSGN